MTASAGVAAASDEGLATAVHGETAEAQAAIVIVSRDTATREILSRELSKRYGGDYQIVVCDRPAELPVRMRDLRAAGLLVALVVGGVGATDPDGIEVLAAVRAIDPAALRVAAVGWGDWQSVRSVFGAVTLGTLDHWVNRPAQAPAEEFHRSITEFLREWGSDRGGGFEPVHVIGPRWSARSQELRDLFARHRVPAGFMTPPPAPAGRCCTTWAWGRRNCRWSCSGSPPSGQPWSTRPTGRSPMPSAS
jgi:thioredoxin reductase (NADPH)